MEDEWIECPHCNGKKMEFPDCEECEGRGWVDDPEGGTMMCPECNGESCSECGGEGFVQRPTMPATDPPSALVRQGELFKSAGG